jgi:hypothetical protein
LARLDSRFPLESSVKWRSTRRLAAKCPQQSRPKNLRMGLHLVTGGNPERILAAIIAYTTPPLAAKFNCRMTA